MMAYGLLPWLRVKGYSGRFMSYVSLEKAARFLLVSEATILKWIEQEKLQARKTSDNKRYLVLRDSVRELLTSSSALIEQIATGTRPIVPCWEFNAENGRMKADCVSCPVFRAREKKCYQVGRFLKESNQGATCCHTDCEDCSYYKYHKERSEFQLVSNVEEPFNNLEQ